MEEDKLHNANSNGIPWNGRVARQLVRKACGASTCDMCRGGCYVRHLPCRMKRLGDLAP